MASIKIPEIKVVDFAYPSKPTALLPPISEIFDQHIGIAEVEYHWGQAVRSFPIPGKTLSRLLDLHWISEAELCKRGSAMDIIELQKHNSKQPQYPWRPVDSMFMTPPTPEERQALLMNHISLFQLQDAIRLKWASKKKGRNANTPIECPKQYPAPLQAYDQNVYPELAHQMTDADRNKEGCQHAKRRRLSRTATLLL
jgi:hypothetical protein